MNIKLCAKELSKASGKPVSQEQAARLEERITKQMRLNAIENPEKVSQLSEQGRLKFAIEESAKKIRIEATQARLLSESNLNKASANLDLLNQMSEVRRARFPKEDNSSTVSLIDRMNQVYIQTQGESRNNYATLLNAMQQVAPKYWRLMGDPAADDALRKAYHDGVGEPEMLRAAKVIKDWVENQRLRMNDAGAQIGKLDYPYMPRSEDVVKLRKLGEQGFVDFGLKYANRDYYRENDGSLKSDAKLTEILKDIYQTKVSRGATKNDPSSPVRGSGLSMHREFHIKGAEGEIAYNKLVGEGSFHWQLQKMVQKMSHDIVMLETFGTNKEAVYSQMLSLSEKLDKGKSKKGNKYQLWVTPQRQWDNLNGMYDMPMDGKLAGAMGSSRMFLTAAILQSNILSQPFDLGTFAMMGRTLGLDADTMAKHLLQSFGKSKRETELAHQGMMPDSMIRNVARYADDITSETFHKLSHLTQMAQGAQQMTDIIRNAAMTLISKVMTTWTRTAEWEKLSIKNQQFLQSKGVTPQDYAIWQKAETMHMDGDETITRDTIARVSDEDISPIIGERLTEIRQEAARRLTRLSERNAEETAWVSARETKLNDRIDSLRKRLVEQKLIVGGKTGKLVQWLDSLKTRASEAIDMAKTENEILAFLSTDKATVKFLDVLEAERRGRASGKYGRNKKIAETTTKFSDKRGWLGESLGKKIGDREAKIADLEKQIKEAFSDESGLFKGMDKETLSKIEDLKGDMEAFITRSEQRSTAREQTMETISNQTDKKLSVEIYQARTQAVSRFLGMVEDEAHFASTEPDLTTRTFIKSAGRPGEIQGEIARAMWMFTSFPLAIITRHLRRMSEMKPGSGKILYMASYAALALALGTLSAQLKAVRDGKDPYNMRDPRFFARALAQSGGLGWLGDTIYAAGSETPTGDSQFFKSNNPMMGFASDLVGLTLGNAMEWQRGEKTHWKAEAINFASRNTPLLNLWWTRAAIQRGIVNDMQEWANPGYSKRIEDRTKKLSDQNFYWRPGEHAPSRMPDFSPETIWKKK